MLKGTVLISPDDKEPYFAFFVKSQIIDNRPTKVDDSIVDERLLMVYKADEKKKEFRLTSPAKFIDLHPPTDFTKPITPPEVVSANEVIEWSFENITIHQLNDTEAHVQKKMLLIEKDT